MGFLVLFALSRDSSNQVVFESWQQSLLDTLQKWVRFELLSEHLLMPISESAGRDGVPTPFQNRLSNVG